MKSSINFGSIEKLLSLSKAGNKLSIENKMPIPTSIMVYGMRVFDEKREAAKMTARNIGIRYSEPITICPPLPETKERTKAQSFKNVL
jgi:hypothetical protein